MSMRLIIRIQEHFATLSPRHKLLAEYILDNERIVFGLSATELSRAAGVSKSAATRFFQALGYESFEAVRLQAREELNRTDPVIAVGARRTAAKPHSVEAYLSREVANLTRTLEGLSSDTLRSVAKSLANSPCLWVAGLDEDDVLARLAAQSLGSVRPNVRMVCDPSMPLENQVASFQPKDALLLFGLAARSPQFDLIVEQAILGELEIIHVTGLKNPSIAAAKINLRCQTQFDGETRSISGVISLLGLLVDRVATLLGPRAQSRRALIASLRQA